MLKRVGYWTEERGPYPRLEAIHPKYLVDPNWEVARRSNIVSYLRSGLAVFNTMGYSRCRFEGGPSGPEMGCRDLSDGDYVWPE